MPPQKPFPSAADGGGGSRSQSTRAVGRAPAATAAGGPPGVVPPLLDIPADTVRVLPSPCRCVACPECVERIKGLRRRWVQSQIASWADVVFLTLTVDVKGGKTGRGFVDGRAAYLRVHRARYVSKLMRALGVCRWVCVLEFTAAGVPHWHLLIDRRVPIADVRSVWCSSFRVGHQVNIQAARSRGGVACYVTDYITKAPNLPAWASSMRRIRFISCARHVQGFVAWEREQQGLPPAVHVTPGRAPGSARGRSRRTISQRVATCGTSCVAFVEHLEADQKRRRYLGKVPLPLRAVAKIAERMGGRLVTLQRTKVLGWVEVEGAWRPAAEQVVGWRGLLIAGDVWNRHLVRAAA